MDSDTAIPTKEALWEGLSNSLLLVAAANHSFNICRRDMFKTDLDDNYKALCNNKHPIGSELFGDDFTEGLKTVTESNKAAKQLTRSNKSVSQKYKGSSKPFFSSRGAQSAPLQSVQFQCTRLPEKQTSQLQEGTFQNRIQDYQTDCETVVTQPEVSSGPITITWGRIKNFISTWQEITSDKTILSVVLGYKLEFYGLQPIQIGKIRPTVLNSEAEASSDQQIQNFLSRDILVESHHEFTEFISPVFLREKKNGTFRMILNLKELNRFIAYHHFKMDNIESCIHLMKPMCFMASIDLSDAYFSLPVDPSHQKYLKFLCRVPLGYLPNSLNLCTLIYDSRDMFPAVT